MKKIGLIFFLGFISAFVSCGQAESFDAMVDGLLEETVPLARPDECPADALFIDARELVEFQTSHLPNAMFVGYDDFDIRALDSIPKNRDLVVYCSVGYRSEKIGEQLIDAGFQNVTNMYGGIFLWVNEGNEVVNENGPTNQVHAYNKAWGHWLVKGEKVYK